MPAIEGLAMKRVSVPFLIGAMLFTVIGLYGCASDGERVAPVDASIGIIETRGTDETSRIVFYDGELNEVAQLSLRYANLGDVFHNPLVYQGSLLLFPKEGLRLETARPSFRSM